MIRSYKYKLYPSKSQEGRLEYILQASRELYNSLLEMQKARYAVEKKFFSNSEMSRVATGLRKKYTGVHAHVFQTTTKRLDLAFKRFFTHRKDGAGFPRFKSAKRHKSFSFKEYGNGFKIRGKKLYVSGVGNVSVRWHRELPATPKTATLKRYPDGWYVIFVVEITEGPDKADKTSEVGLDFGLKNFVTDSNGTKIPNPKYFKKTLSRIKHVQAELSKKQKGSRRYYKTLHKLQKLYQKTTNQKKDFLHKLSRQLVTRNRLIVLEDINISNLRDKQKSKAAKRTLIHTNFSEFVRMLQYKAEEAGTEVVLVNPAYTSKTCSACGHVNRGLQITQRMLVCEACGAAMDRDHNAAVNILRAGRALRQTRREAARLQS